jgi:hypothetical protein
MNPKIRRARFIFSPSRHAMIKVRHRTVTVEGLSYYLSFICPALNEFVKERPCREV